MPDAHPLNLEEGVKYVCAVSAHSYKLSRETTMWRGHRIPLVPRHPSNSGVLLFDWHLKTHAELR